MSKQNSYTYNIHKDSPEYDEYDDYTEEAGYVCDRCGEFLGKNRHLEIELIADRKSGDKILVNICDKCSRMILRDRLQNSSDKEQNEFAIDTSSYVYYNTLRIMGCNRGEWFNEKDIQKFRMKNKRRRNRNGRYKNGLL